MQITKRSVVAFTEFILTTVLFFARSIIMSLVVTILIVVNFGYVVLPMFIMAIALVLTAAQSFVYYWAPE